VAVWARGLLGLHKKEGVLAQAKRKEFSYLRFMVFEIESKKFERGIQRRFEKNSKGNLRRDSCYGFVHSKL